ncbi:unnamed protein product [Parajaminaea phylloscopi]
MAPTASFVSAPAATAGTKDTRQQQQQLHTDVTTAVGPTAAKKIRRSSWAAATPATAPEIIDGRCVWHWKDAETIAEGWIVIDAPEPTAAGGGLFLHEQATLQEVRDVACAMSTKLAVSSQPQVVGAKGGIRFSHRDAEAPRVLERFIRDNAAVISTYWGTGGDLNTSHALIDQYAKQHCGAATETALDALSKALHCPTSATDIPALLKETVALPSGLKGVEWSLEEYSVGYVMAVTLQKMLQRTSPELIGRARLVIQGFGCVGATFAQAVQELGLGRIVGISSQYGFLVDEQGIDVAAINELRRANVTAGKVVDLDPNSLEAGLTSEQKQHASYTPRDRAATDEMHLQTFLKAAKGEVFVPCACRYVLTDKVTQALVESTFAGLPLNNRYIVAGANNIFPQSSSQAKCLARLDSDSILMLPEWVSNSGTANLFMRTCSGLALLGHASSNLAACADDAAAFIDAVFKMSNDNELTSSRIWQSCAQVAATRRRRGAVNLLGVKRISHLNLISPNAERSRETFTKVGNVSPLSNGLLKLPGADGATLSISQAPDGAEPADTGLHIRFCVYNIEKTRRVLQKERVAFTETVAADGAHELELCGEKAGYPMSFRQGTRAELTMSTCVALPSSQSAAVEHEAAAAREASVSLVEEVKQMDHYTLIVPDASAVKTFHERMMGYTHLRTITLNAGAAPEGEEDMLNHVMALPMDGQRVLVITEGLIPESIFSKLLQKKRRPYVHHIALEVGNVEAAFAGVRAAGWGTTSDKISKDMLSGLRQFFLKEEEAGCFLELIERSDCRPQQAGQATGEGEEAPSSQGGGEHGDEDDQEGSNSKRQGDFRRGNMASLAQSMESYVK